MLFQRLFICCMAVLLMGAGDQPNSLTIDGLVTIDGKPSAADIEINSTLKSGKYSSQLHTGENPGNFSTRLPLQDEYEIVVRVANFPQQVLLVSALSMTRSGSLNVYADFTSPEYDHKLDDLKRSVEEQLRRERLSFDPKTFEARYGDVSTEMLRFQVQVAAYRFFENFNYQNVAGFPKIIRYTDPDQITRFTMGSYDTYNEAKILLTQIRKQRLKDAFIIAVYKGEKKSLPELVQLGILK